MRQRVPYDVSYTELFRKLGQGDPAGGGNLVEQLQFQGFFTASSRALPPIAPNILRS